jgi:hypothetical protein
MRDKEPELVDPSGYACGVKCSATLTRKATQYTREKDWPDG